MIADIIVIAVIAIIFGLCLRKLIIGMKHGGCEGCGGNCGSCGGCSYAKTNQKDQR